MSDPEPTVVDEDRAAVDPIDDDEGLRLLRRRFHRPSRLQVMSVGLVTLLALGPLIALIVVVGADDGAVDDLLTGPPAAVGGARVVTTITSVSPAAGEMRMRMLVVPRDDLLDDAGRPLVDLVARTNDIRGLTTNEFPAGEPLRPVEVVVALGAGSISRYPFDAYTGRFAIAISAADDGEEPRAVPVVLDIRSNVNDLSVSLGPPTDADVPVLRVVDFNVDRRIATTAYAVWVMVLMWGLAVAGVLIVWAVTIWGAEPPIWSYAYFVGVLFALPQLRDQLPGSPPPGTLLDFVAFYWSIAIVGVSLIISLGIWIRANRPLR